MGYVKGLFLAAALVGLFLVITMVIINISGGPHMTIGFVMGFACARALEWFQRRGRRSIGP